MNHATEIKSLVTKREEWLVHVEEAIQTFDGGNENASFAALNEAKDISYEIQEGYETFANDTGAAIVASGETIVS